MVIYVKSDSKCKLSVIGEQEVGNVDSVTVVSKYNNISPMTWYRADSFKMHGNNVIITSPLAELVTNEDYEEAYRVVYHTSPLRDNRTSDVVVEKKVEKNTTRKPVRNTARKPSPTGKITSSILDTIRKNVECPTPERDGFYVDNKVWMYLVRNIMRNKPTMLIGPTGTGKTELVKIAAERIGMECCIYDMGSMQDPLTDLLGSHRLENGNSVFDYAKFTRDIQKKCVIVLDELSRAPLMANNILLPCLDSRRELPVEIADSKSDRCIKVHPECVFVATTNIDSEYAGTNEIDAALMNRFLPLQLGYMPEACEINVLTHRTGCSDDVAKATVSIARAMRKANMSGTLSKSCSVRETLSIAELIVDGFSINEAIEFVLIQKFMPDEYEDEQLKVRTLLAGC